MVEQAPTLVGQSPAFLKALEETSNVAELAKPVLIVGERGTGKELFAARLHYLSPRWDSVYLQLNCATLTETLLETELFGHEAGAFTGATRRHLGRFERASSGTLFLDELATTSQRVQEKILRVIEYGEFERVGGSNTIQTDVRIVAATNEDLPTLAHEGRFRIDLLDRLAFDVITLPPLRERAEDILLLAEHFAVNMANELKRELFPGFSDSATKILMEHDWPGNVRELKNVVERAVYRNDPDNLVGVIVLDPFDSPFRLNKKTHQVHEVVSEIEDLEFPIQFRQRVDEFEVSILRAALEKAQFNQRKTAELLGLSYNQLRNSVRKHNISRIEEDGSG
ncbi:MAG: phage shock protein operon transcriptional activator [Gammaproteobacteria bacterium]|nr:phage shock protein operon transcriptional activator [Gammaproteobacteria bacterium]MYF38211.1 phage shock protein operon transcriptional activator [Gammaproteobacteria bacterium]